MIMLKRWLIHDLFIVLLLYIVFLRYCSCLLKLRFVILGFRLFILGISFGLEGFILGFCCFSFGGPGQNPYPYIVIFYL